MTSYLVVDLGYGDAGKGTTVDALARHTGAKLVVRYNGGAQAAHNVVDEFGRHHTFRQFGSASMRPGVRTLHSKWMLVNPLLAVQEARELIVKGVSDPLRQLYIDERALVTTPYHRAMNRLREMSRAHCHGSCGVGIGETRAYALRCPTSALRIGDLRNRDVLIEKLRTIRQNLVCEVMMLTGPKRNSTLVTKEMSTFQPELESAIVGAYEQFLAQVNVISPDQVKELLNGEDSIFEGAQGVLLDEDVGFHPYTTWTCTTLRNADDVLDEAGSQARRIRIGVVRTYMSRHGVGPLTTEHSPLGDVLTERHNCNNQWQRNFRVGWLDFVALKYALRNVGPLDTLSVTHCDQLSNFKNWRVCTEYKEDLLQANVNPEDLIKREALSSLLATATPVYDMVPATWVVRSLEHALDVTAGITSFGPRSDLKVFDEDLFPQLEAKPTDSSIGA
jgi:adenylosuccinate synthase